MLHGGGAARVLEIHNNHSNHQTYLNENDIEDIYIESSSLSQRRNIDIMNDHYSWVRNELNYMKTSQYITI